MGGPLPSDSGWQWPGRWAGLATATLPNTPHKFSQVKASKAAGPCLSKNRKGSWTSKASGAEP